MTKEKVEIAETAEEVRAETNTVSKKIAAMKEFIERAKINGVQLIDANENNKILRSNLPIEGQILPMFIVVNDTVYSYIQVHLVTVTEDKAVKCLPYLNELNERFSMLKYFVNNGGNIVLTCSVPASDDAFEPALLIALIDQVKKHLEENYAELMKKVWQE